MSDDDYELLTFLVTQSERPLPGSDSAKAMPPMERVCSALRRTSIAVISLGYAVSLQERALRLAAPFIFGNLMLEAGIYRSLEEPQRLYASRIRHRLREEMKQPRLFTGQWNNSVLAEKTGP
jgi:hypothetical protein